MANGAQKLKGMALFLEGVGIVRLPEHLNGLSL
jgi:hypothetical protein